MSDIANVNETDAHWSAICDKSERKEAMLDTMVDSMWKDDDVVELHVEQNADVIAGIVIELNNGAISREEAGERLLSSIEHWLRCQAEREIE